MMQPKGARMGLDLKLAVIEGRWWKNMNTSVKPLFDLIGDLVIGNPNGYHYETFADGDAFQEVVQRLGRQNGIRHLYIAAHGSEDGQGLLGVSGQPISRTRIRNAFKETSFDGLMFGSCFPLDEVFAAQLFDACSPLKWAAGYAADIDWITSSAMDLVFWNEIAEGITDEDGMTHAQLRDAVVAKIAQIFPFQALTDGFEVYARSAEGARPLMERACLETLDDFLVKNKKALADSGYTVVRRASE